MNVIKCFCGRKFIGMDAEHYFENHKFQIKQQYMGQYPSPVAQVKTDRKHFAVSEERE